ncbi:hypothetical protein JXD38_11440 [candidate division WOR-3 bacterium]|nr:hypothetical protein [candidate division WOR-3 bacterium]
MRTVTVSAVVCCLVLALFAGCQQNQPPATPQLTGPETGIPGKSLTFTYSTTDPEKQSIAYLISWGDGSTEDWDEGYSSGEEVTRSHKFADSGSYVVKVKARDTKEVESGWSNSLAVAVAFWPPDQPLQPTGQTACTTGVATTFATRTSHPLGDSVWFQFDWGDTIGDWGGPVAPDSLYSEEHSFSVAGTLNVMVRAKDARDHASPWSDPLAVSVTFVAAPAKPDVVYQLLNKGAALRLTWGTVPDANFYEVRIDDSVHAITDTNYQVTEPCATLEVRAAKGSRKSDPAVIPVGMVETAPVVIYGMSDPDTAHHNGFGIDTAGTVTTYRLISANYAKLDFYADDNRGDSIFLISAGILGTKGNVLKDAGTSVYDEAELADTTGYADENLLVMDGVYYLWLDPTNNGWSTDDHFAKTKISQVSGRLVSMEVVGYQRVGGLRWLSR